MAARKVVVEITGDSKGYSKATDDAVKISEGFAGKLRKAAGEAKSGFLQGFGIGGGISVFDTVAKAVGGLVDKVGQSIELASDKAEAASKANVLFGDSYNLIERASRSAATAVGMSSGAYIAAAGDVGNLLKNMGIAGQEAASMSKNMLQLAADVGSFNNADPTEVVEAMGAAFRGESDPIQRFGVFLSAAKVEAKAMAMGLRDGKKPLTDYAKAMATYQIILEQTAAAQGDFARTADGKANADRIRAAQAEEAWTRLGEVLTPLYQKVMPLIANATTTAIDTITNLANVAAPLVDGALQGIANAIDTIGDSFTALKELMDPTGTEADRVTRAIMDQATALGLDADAVVAYTEQVKARAKAERERLAVAEQIADVDATIAAVTKNATDEINTYRQAIKDGGDAEALNNIIMERKLQLNTQLAPYLRERDRLLGVQRQAQDDLNKVDNEGIRIQGIATKAVADYNRMVEESAQLQTRLNLLLPQTVASVDTQTSSFSRAASELNLGYGSVLLATVEAQDKAAAAMAPDNPKGVARAVENTVDRMFMSLDEAKGPWKEQWQRLAAWAKDPFTPEKFEEWVSGRVKQAMKKARESFGAEKKRWLEIARAYRFIAKNEWIDPMKADIEKIMIALRLASRITEAANQGGAAQASIDMLTGKRAAGGPVSAGGTYLVGEDGPELLTMGRNSGFVTPNHAIAGGGGTTVVNVTVNVPPTANLADVGREITRALKAFGQGGGQASMRAAIGVRG